MNISHACRQTGCTYKCHCSLKRCPRHSRIKRKCNIIDCNSIKKLNEYICDMHMYQLSKFHGQYKFINHVMFISFLDVRNIVLENIHRMSSYLP